jgi:hypothetical protein
VQLFKVQLDSFIYTYQITDTPRLSVQVLSIRSSRTAVGQFEVRGGDLIRRYRRRAGLRAELKGTAGGTIGLGCTSAAVLLCGKVQRLVG